MCNVKENPYLLIRNVGSEGVTSQIEIPPDEKMKAWLPALKMNRKIPYSCCGLFQFDTRLRHVLAELHYSY